MKIYIAGAGAGKTTCLSTKVQETVQNSDGIVFCLAFTNEAVRNISSKIRLYEKPEFKRIRVSTIHSFLYNECIRPYYHLLFGKQFQRISNVALPQNRKYKKYKNMLIRDLEDRDILHITSIPEKAKWVFYKKSREKKDSKTARTLAISEFKEYCSAIYIDEAQDIDKDMKEILLAMDKSGIRLELYGDPKQDVRGHGCFRQLINDSHDLNYIRDCHRCPQKHLLLSNTLADENEKQETRNAHGEIIVAFETCIKDVQSFITNGKYGLSYIRKKNERFDTHSDLEQERILDALFQEVLKAMEVRWREEKTKIEITRAAYYLAERMIHHFASGKDADSIINRSINQNIFYPLSTQSRHRMVDILTMSHIESNCRVKVSSIESVKGLESERCLFVLTHDLAPYLFGLKKDDGQSKHLLYVALTRSSKHLTILVTKEVEDEYSQDYILKYINNIISTI